MSKKKQSPLAACGRLWFSVTTQERWLLFGIAALLLLGLTVRHLHLRAQTPTPVEPPTSETVFYGKEPAQ